MTATPGKPTQQEAENRTGYCRLRRGSAETDPKTKLPTTEPLWNYERLVPRAGPLGAWLIVYIIDRTLSSYRGDNVPPPQYAELQLPELCTFLHVSDRQVRNLIEFLAAPERRFISRHPQHRWMYRTHPENFEIAPVIERVKRPRRPRVVAIHAPDTTAALAREIHFPEGESRKGEADGGSAQPTSEVHFNATETPPCEMHFTRDSDVRQQSVKGISETVQSISEAQKCNAPTEEMAFQNPEVCCPLGWSCPFTVNGLEEDKPLNFITINIKTASQALPAAENEGWQAAIESEIFLMLTNSEVSSLFPNQTPGSTLLPDARINLQGAPVGLLKRRIWQRHKQGYVFESMGVVKGLAKEIGDRWQLDHAAAWKQEEQERMRRFASVREQAYHFREGLHRTFQELQSLADTQTKF